MNIETFETYRRNAQSLTPSDQANLKSLIASPQLADCVSLISYLLELGLKLEQMVISAIDMIKRIK
jgi:hypothetical protein